MEFTEDMMRAALEGKVFYEHTHPRSGKPQAREADPPPARPKRKYQFEMFKMAPEFTPLRDAVAQVYGVEPELVISSCRDKKVMMARRVFIAEAHRRSGYSYSLLGRHFGMDHASIIYHLQIFHANPAQFAVGVEKVRGLCP